MNSLYKCELNWQLLILYLGHLKRFLFVAWVIRTWALFPITPLKGEEKPTLKTAFALVHGELPVWGLAREWRGKKAIYKLRGSRLLAGSYLMWSLTGNLKKATKIHFRKYRRTLGKPSFEHHYLFVTENPEDIAADADILFLFTIKNPTVTFRELDRKVYKGNYTLFGMVEVAFTVEVKAMTGMGKTVFHYHVPFATEMTIDTSLYQIEDWDRSIFYQKKDVARELPMVLNGSHFAERTAIVNAFYEAERQAAQQIEPLLAQSSLLPQLAEILMMPYTAPADLETQLAFQESDIGLANNTMDAGEPCNLLVTLTNRGKGTAFQVQLAIQSNRGDIDFDVKHHVGNINPGETSQISVPLRPGLNLAEGIAHISVQAHEERGFHGEPNQVQITTATLQAPELVFLEMRLDDSGSGGSQGNGNGRAENGETVELTVLVKNQGSGPALRVETKLHLDHPLISLSPDRLAIPQIEAGGIAASVFRVHLPRGFQEPQLNLRFRAADIRGASDFTRELTLPVHPLAPNVICSEPQILLGNGNEILETGETAVMTLSIANKGSLNAENVTLHLDSKDLHLSPNQTDLGLLEEGQARIARFQVTTPRVFEKERENITVTLKQRDFPATERVFAVPIGKRQPHLEISHRVLPSGDQVIKGSPLNIAVLVRNRGTMDAEDVTLSLKPGANRELAPGLYLETGNQGTVPLGRLVSNGEGKSARFYFSTRRSASSGPVDLTFSLTQGFFDPMEYRVTLTLLNAPPTVVRVTPEVAPAIPVTDGVKPPVIFIANDPGDQVVTTRMDRWLLMGSAHDFLGIQKLEVTVNGKRVPITTGARNSNLKERRFSVGVPLEPGENHIRVRAWNFGEKSEATSFRVLRQADEGTVWGVAIGVNRYQAAPDLNYATADARGFAAYLTDHAPTSPIPSLSAL